MALRHARQGRQWESSRRGLPLRGQVQGGHGEHALQTRYHSERLYDGQGVECS